MIINTIKTLKLTKNRRFRGNFVSGQMTFLLYWTCRHILFLKEQRQIRKSKVSTVKGCLGRTSQLSLAEFYTKSRNQVPGTEFGQLNQSKILPEIHGPNTQKIQLKQVFRAWSGCYLEPREAKIISSQRRHSRYLTGSASTFLRLKQPPERQNSGIQRLSRFPKRGHNTELDLCGS